MKVIKKSAVIFSVIILSFLAFPVFGCKNNDYYVFDSINYFNTRTYIALEKNGKEQEFSAFTENLLSSLEKEFSLNANNSFVNKINSANAFENVGISDLIKDVLLISENCHSFAPDFDPTIYPLLRLWKLSSDTYPYENFDELFISETLEKVSDILPLCDFNKIHVNASENYVYKTEDGIKTDFGGIIKGYATEKLYEKAVSLGYDTGYISLGGSSMHMLSLKDDLSVTHPRRTGFLLSVDKDAVKNKSVSTSGDYNRYYEIDGKRYSHIIDVKTGAPINTGIAAATLIGLPETMGDALSTAVCCATYSPTEKETSPLFALLSKIVLQYTDCTFFITYINGEKKQVITNANSADYRLLDDSFEIVCF